MRNVLILIVMLSFTDIFAQEYRESELLVFENKKVECNYHIYNPPFPAKGIYKDTTEALNLFPEQVISSIMSATNQKWVDYNYTKGDSRKYPDSHFAAAKKLNKAKNYYELRSKFEFTHNGQPTVFIKYYSIFENQKQSDGGFKVIKKIGMRWYATLIPNFKTIPFMLFWFNDERMKELLIGNKTGNSLTDELIAKTRDISGNLDFIKLSKEFSQIYEEGANSARYKYFIDSTAYNYK